MKSHAMIKSMMSARSHAKQRKYKKAYKEMEDLLDILMKSHQELEISANKLELEVARLKDHLHSDLPVTWEFLKSQQSQRTFTKDT